jgi:hypothetical protein
MLGSMRTAGMLLAIVCMLAVFQSRPSARSAAAKRDIPFFSCKTFPADISRADLVKRFGTENVTDELIEGGGSEGEMNPGTVLFAKEAELRVEIYWKDKEAKQNPDWMNIRQERSNWRSPEGVTMGTDLVTLERLNGRAFRLLGFGYDSEGAVTSWKGGKLEDANGPGCILRIWLMPKADEENPAAEKLEREVTGMREFSSDHPAMRGLNPRAYEMMLDYQR